MYIYSPHPKKSYLKNPIYIFSFKLHTRQLSYMEFYFKTIVFYFFHYQKIISLLTLALVILLQSCWNCGRKAHETCSGCSVARYCGPFCQHKDWENHHQVCTKEKIRPLTNATTTTPSSHINQTESIKFKK